MSLHDLHELLGMAHDLVCSLLLFLIFIAQIRLHNENRTRLDRIARRLGILDRRDENGQ